jgi:hypothetical protein
LDGQAGAWDSSRQPGYTHTNGLSATHGGHGGGDAGEGGGTTPCNDMAKGGGGGTQEEPGVAGESNRGALLLTPASPGPIGPIEFAFELRKL